MIFSLDVQRALQGDCLIVHYGSGDNPGLALIDGGPGPVYGSRLKQRLAQIRAARALGDDQALGIDLLMVSHIDSDHIGGILQLTGELVSAKEAKQPQPLKIRSFWHNTFDNIIGNKPDELLSAVTASSGAASLDGEPDREEMEPAAAMVLAGVGQGFRLSADARKLNLPHNPQFNGRLIMAVQEAEAIDMGRDLSLVVVGPMKRELDDLQQEYDEWLKKRSAEKKTTAVPAAFTDTSIPNLSSIVILAEAGGKRMLFTGDARGDKILQGLELVGLLKAGDRMHVDILKMPHHGSDRNLDPIFFQRIRADHYVFSGNGKYGNPERKTLQMLLDESGGRQFMIHLTYPIGEIDARREEDWKREQQKEKVRKARFPGVAVREDWSPEKHSLTNFFSVHEDFARKVRIAEEGKPHIIDLLEKVGF